MASQERQKRRQTSIFWIKITARRQTPFFWIKITVRRGSKYARHIVEHGDFICHGMLLS